MCLQIALFIYAHVLFILKIFIHIVYMSTNNINNYVFSLPFSSKIIF